MDGPITPGMLTRNKARGLVSPRPMGLEDVPQGAVAATPKTRRQAQVFGTPISAFRLALEDRTNESPAQPQPFGSTLKGVSAGGPSAKAGTPKRSAAKGPRSGTPRAARAPAGAAEEGAARAESPEASAEELLRSEVSRIRAGLPEVMETPVLAKRKVQSKIVIAAEASKGGPAREDGEATEGGPRGEAVQGTADTEPETQRTLAGLCFSPTVSLAPTPANTPIAGVPSGSQRQAPHRALNNGAVSASLHALAVARAASEAAAAAAAGAGSGAAPGSGAGAGAGVAAGTGPSSGLRSSASRSRKPPMPRPTRGTPKASAQLAAIRIATPIGRTPPPRAFVAKNGPVSLPAEEITSPASSPERPTRALTFDSPPANRSLPSSPAQGSRSRAVSGTQGANGPPSSGRSAVPPSPAWSLDVNISTPAVGHGQVGAEEAYPMQDIEDLEWEGEEGEEGEGSVNEYWEGGEEGEYEYGMEDGGEDYGYEGGNEFDGDAEDVCEGLSGLSVSGRSVTLRGLPPPAGTHIHFGEDE